MSKMYIGWDVGAWGGKERAENEAFTFIYEPDGNPKTKIGIKVNITDEILGSKDFSIFLGAVTYSSLKVGSILSDVYLCSVHRTYASIV